MSSTKHVAHNLECVERTADIVTRENVTFTELLLSDKTLAGLKTCGFIKPSPIQLKALPLGKCGFDLIIEAKSGTGKTAVFTIIALEMIDTNAFCQVVILAPTREIASQIGQVITSIGYAYEGLRVEVVMGGTNLNDDISRLKNNKYQILVGSPGRLKHLIKAKNISLDTVRLFVMDEADKLMEECFQSDVNYIFSVLPPRKQVIVASATYTRELRDFLSVYMRSPSHICPYSSSILIGVNQFSSIVPSHLNTVRQNHINFDELKKILSEIPFKQCLIFCNYQSRTQKVYSELHKSGWPVEYLAGSQTQQDRLQSLRKLQDFKCRVLVATDLAARGIDAANVDLVVNLELPWDMSTYLHRIGRAGRYGSKGTAITIVPAEQNQKFLSLFENFGHDIQIKPLRTLSSQIPTVPEVNLLSTPEMHNDEAKEKNMLSLMVSAQKCEIPLNNFDTLINSLNNFESPLHGTFDSLLDSKNNFTNTEPSQIPTHPEVNPLSSPEMHTDEAKEQNVLSLMVSPQKCEIPMNNFDTLINSFNTFESPLHATFDSLLDSMNNFTNSKLSNEKGPNCDILKHVNTIVKINESPKSIVTNDFNGVHNEKNTQNNDDNTYSHGDFISKTCNLNKEFQDVDINSNPRVTFSDQPENPVPSGIPKKNDSIKSSPIQSELNGFDNSSHVQSDNYFDSSKSKFKPVLSVCKSGKNVKKESEKRNKKKGMKHNECSFTNSNDPCRVSVEDYLQWKSQLSLMTQYIQQQVYIHTLNELSTIKK